MSAPVIRPMEAAHLPAVAALEQACFSRPWSEAALREELHNPVARFTVALIGGEVAGYLGLHVPADEGFIDNVAVRADCRRQGVAAALLADAARWAAAQGLARLTLEVRVSNAAAIALYERAGYVRDGVRPRFYDRPTEDAALYSLYLKEGSSL